MALKRIIINTLQSLSVTRTYVTTILKESTVGGILNEFVTGHNIAFPVKDNRKPRVLKLSNEDARVVSPSFVNSMLNPSVESCANDYSLESKDVAAT